MKKIAVVLFNLGGPDRPESIQPFLFNLFNDPAIIGAPGPIRWLLAHYISKKRAPVAAEIYSHLGGKSPLLELTQDQAQSLTDALMGEAFEAKCFIAMRYWKPFTKDAVVQVKDWGADEVILLPLYPQFSTATTGSSVKAWTKAAKKARLAVPTQTLCCYPTETGLVDAFVNKIKDLLGEAEKVGQPRLLFSAHGLPKKVIEKGDPYQHQVEQTSKAVAERLKKPDLDWVVCYQSRVGPLEWIGPSTDDEIARAGTDGVPLIVVPIAFVSEHSETLVELDIEYGALAKEKGVPAYFRAPALGSDPAFISGLADLVRQGVKLLDQGAGGLCSHAGDRFCPSSWSQCPYDQPKS